MTSRSQLSAVFPTQVFAEFGLWPAEAVPESAQHAARRTIANSIALSVGATRHPAYRRARAVLTKLGTPPQATALGTGEKFGMSTSALLNGVGAHVEDFDDTHLRTVIHPGAPIVPAALAMAEFTEANAEALVTAVALGVEVALRIGNGICPSHFDRGWHLTSTTGHLGAAIAAGRLLGLDVRQMEAALALAATEAAGLQEALGTMTKSYHPGKAASDGVEAALLASYGFSGPEEPIAGPLGFARTASPAQDFAIMLEDLGQHWEVEDNAIKPYSCGIVSHPIIDAAIELRDRVPVDEIERVVVRTNPVVLDVMGVKDPKDGLQSKFSAYHCFAVGIVHAAGGPEQFSNATALDPQVRNLRRRVEVVVDASIAMDECFAELHTIDGRTLEAHILHATASAASPMTDEQLSKKVCLMAGPVLGDQASKALASASLNLGGALAVSDFIALTNPRT